MLRACGFLENMFSLPFVTCGSHALVWKWKMQFGTRKSTNTFHLRESELGVQVVYA